MSNPIKPLYANLKRLRIGDYLSSKEFELLVIEGDVDDEWAGYLKEAKAYKNIIAVGFSAYNHEEAFLRWMEDVHSNQYEDFGAFLLPVLISFAKWSKAKLDFTNVIENLKEIFSRSTILEFTQELRKAQKNKVIPVKGVLLEVPETVLPITNEPNKKVFIVHGWDEIALMQLETLLKAEFDLEPVVMKNKPNETVETIIAKFERLATGCDTAIVLMTPDDKTEDNTRARQNVVFELGWFLGKFSNQNPRRIMIIKKGNIEIPSDIQGVLYHPYNNQIKELYLDLKNQFKEWKLI